MTHLPGGAKPGTDRFIQTPPGEPAILADEPHLLIIDHSRPMKTLICTVLASAMFIFSCAAKEYKLPADKPTVAIDIPDSWSPTAIQKGYQTQTADQTVYLSIEMTASEKEMTATIDETDTMLKSHKVVLDKPNRKDNKFKLNGLPSEEILYNGHDEDGPTMVSITFVTVRKTAVVFTYWASVDGNKKHQEELGKILNSLRLLGS